MIWYDALSVELFPFLFWSPDSGDECEDSDFAEEDEEEEVKVHHQVLCSPIQKALGERSLQFVFFVPTNKSTAINPQLDINIYFQRKKILALATGAHPLIEKTIRPQSGGGRAAK